MTTRDETPGEDRGPRDWRRRRRQAQEGQPPQPAEAQPEADDETAGDEAVLSRPLVSILEPAMDAVGVYGAPVLLAGIIGLVTGITIVAFVSSMRLYGYIDIAIGAGLIAIVAVVFISSVIAAFVSRTGRYGINTLILLGAFTGIVIVANVISFENVTRLDVTATNQFTLASRTKDLLDGLPVDIRATAFYKEGGQADEAEVAQRRNRVVETLREFSSRSGRFTHRVVDPDLEPEVVAKYFGARPTGFVSEIVVVENMESEEFDTIQRTDANYTQLEQDLVTATYVATGQEQKLVYFLTGHGERNISNTAPHGYDAVRNGLEQDNYRATSLVWGTNATDVEVPEDAAVVVVAGPTSELPEAHAAALDRYLQGQFADGSSRRENGSLIFLAEPDTPESFKEFLLQWGVILSGGYIRDLDSSLPGLPQTVNLGAFNPAAPLEIVQPKGQQLQNVFFPGSAAMQTIDDELRQALPLALSSFNSFLIEDPDRVDPITEGDNADPRGPFLPAVLVRSIGKVGSPPPLSPPTEEQFADIMVFGDSDFLANSGFDRGGGADLFLNSTNFLLGDFSLVSLRPKAFSYPELNLDRNEYDFVRFASWLILPGLMALLAGLVWWVRR